MALTLVPRPAPVRCHFKFICQQGRGGNRKAIYVCQSHAYPSGCLPFAARGWKTQGKRK